MLRLTLHWVHLKLFEIFTNLLFFVFSNRDCHPFTASELDFTLVFTLFISVSV